MKIVIFADLDGTILDKKYSFHKIKSTIDNLLSLNVDIVLCSSKTKAEIEFYREEMKINHPFISENGGAIFIPKNFFKTQEHTRITKDYDVIELGTPYHLLRQKIKKIAQKTGSNIIGFGDTSLEEVAKDTGLSVKMAEMAKQREYDEPFRIDHVDQKLFDAVKEEGLCIIKGDAYYHLSGQHNKGDGVSRLKLLYAEKFNQLRTIGVGNGPNDLPLLAEVDSPFYRRENESIEKTWKKILKEVKTISSSEINH